MTSGLFGLSAEGSGPQAGATYDSDAAARLNVSAITAGIAAGKGLPASLSSLHYWDKANIKHSFDEAQFLTFAAAMRDWTVAVYFAVRDHKDALDAIAADTTLTEQQRRAAIAAYDITIGWPA